MSIHSGLSLSPLDPVVAARGFVFYLLEKPCCAPSVCFDETWRHQCFVSFRSFVQSRLSCSFLRLPRLQVVVMAVTAVIMAVITAVIMAVMVTGMVVMVDTGVVVMPTGVVDTGAVMVAVGGVQASPSVSAAITDVAAGTRTMATIPAATVGATRSVTGASTTGPRVARAGKLCEPPREAASEHCVLRALVLLLVLINVLGRALLIFPACLRSNS